MRANIYQSNFTSIKLLAVILLMIQSDETKLLLFQLLSRFTMATRKQKFY